MGICPKELSLVVYYLRKRSGKSSWEVNGACLFGLLQRTNALIYKYFITAKNVTFDYKITNGYAYTMLHHYTCGFPVFELNITAYISYDQTFQNIV